MRSQESSVYFVSPKAIPQPADAGELTKRVLEKYGDRGLDLFALVPNLRGAKNARTRSWAYLCCIFF